MVRLRAKNRGRKIIYSGWSLIILVIAIFIIGRGVFSVFQKEKETKSNLNEINEELVELEDRRELLVEEIKKLSTERGVEEEIRDKFRVAKNNEKMLMLIDGPEEKKEDNNKNDNFWSRIFNRF